MGHGGPVSTKRILFTMRKLSSFFRSLHVRQQAQDGFEYLLVSGAIVTAVIAAIVLGITPGPIATLVTAVITAITNELPA